MCGSTGKRVGRTNGGTTTILCYGPGWIFNEKQGSSSTVAHAHGNALIRKDGEYPMFDGLGSERTVTNSSQAVTGTISYDAFGQTVATTGSSADPFKWLSGSGYRDDGDFGLVSIGARVYDPEVGRFLERDSRLDQLAYTYCNGDPINCVDPSGHGGFWDYFKAVAVGAVIGVVVGTAIAIAAPVGAVAIGVIIVGGGAVGGGVGGYIGSGGSGKGAAVGAGMGALFALAWLYGGGQTPLVPK